MDSLVTDAIAWSAPVLTTSCLQVKRLLPRALGGMVRLRGTRLPGSSSRLVVGVVAVTATVLTAACGTGGSPTVGTQTHWLSACDFDDECGGDLRCHCHVCTTSCDGSIDGCASLGGASCVTADETGAVALCDGSPPPLPGLCLPRCESSGCPDGTACTAGVCAALGKPTATVTVDTSVRDQELIGFGAGIGWPTGEIAQHPAGAALFDAMFGESGFGVLRLFNQYDGAGTDLSNAASIVAAAAERLGRTPTLLLSSSSPPAALKANGSTACSGNPDTCTLSQSAAGVFDYAEFATHWRTSLEAYSAAGISPTYISIQNDPNWTPPSSSEIDACGFLPREGTNTVNVDGTDVDVEYPGYDEALAAVVQQLEGLASPPMIAAPETTGVASTTAFVAELDLARVDAIAHHLYDSDPDVLDRDALRALRDVGASSGLPTFQTEMQAEGLDTAVLIHEALSTIGASVYLQNNFVESVSVGKNPAALIALTETGFTRNDPYHAMSHYARDTGPGWVRVEAVADGESVLATAWLSPDEDALTVVLVNPNAEDAVVELDVGGSMPGDSHLTRTVFSGVERSTDLGELSSSGLRLPGESIVTVAMHW